MNADFFVFDLRKFAFIYRKRKQMPRSEDKHRKLIPSWWVYKCNRRQHEHQKDWGDWEKFFSESYPAKWHWGDAKKVSDLRKLKKGDWVIAYQTDRNELVGVAQVRRSCEHNDYLYLTPIEIIRFKNVKHLKSDPRIAAIPALQRGPIKTVYELSSDDALYLVNAAKKNSTPIAKDIAEPPDRVESRTYRILRDTALARRIKELHRYRCQVCHGDALKLADDNFYAEAHHIKPLGSSHRGLDVPENILCVCPNCHVLLDYGAIPITSSKLGNNPNHSIKQEYIEYHNTCIYQNC